MDADKFTYPKKEDFANTPANMVEAEEDNSRARIGIAVIIHPKLLKHPPYIEERKRWCLDCIKANGRYDSEKPVYFEFEGTKLKVWQYIDNMKKLKQITFTGIDGWTDVSELKMIQREYPMVEFGVLLSKNWRENGMRYYNPDALGRLDYEGLNLSCHLCGEIAREAVRNNFNPVIDLCKGKFDIFKRCQLNIAGYTNNPEKLVLDVPDTLEEVVIQQKSVDDIGLWKSGLPNPKLSVLLDASGGRGIDTAIRVLDTPLKVGYAGGISVENVVEKVRFLEYSPLVRQYWIDMESSVRTDDVFDVDKVWDVLNRLDIK